MTRKTVLVALLVVVAAVTAWIYFPPTMRSLSTSLVSTDDTKRNLGLMRLQDLKPAQKPLLINELMAATSSPDWQTRRYALYALRKIGADREKFFPAAVALLDDPNEQVRQEATIILTGMGADVLPELVKALPQKSGPGRDEIFRILTGMGNASTPHLVPLLKDSNPTVRSRAAILINTFEPARTDTISTHIETLKKTGWDQETLGAVKALRNLGPKAKAAVPALTVVLKTGNDNLKDPNAPRPAVAEALNKIDPRRNELVALLWDLKQKDPVVRYRAAYQLSEMTPGNPGALPDLLRAMDDKDLFVRARATVAAARIGFDKSERLKPALTKKAIESLTVVKEEQVVGFSEILQDALAIRAPKADEETAVLNDPPTATAP